MNLAVYPRVPLARLALLLAVLSVTALRPTPAHAAGITVTTTEDATPPTGACSLRQAIEAANTDEEVGGCTAGSGADTITFAAGVTGTITLATTLPAIASVISIEGPGAGSLTLSGGGTVRLLRVNPGAQLALTGLTLAGGRSIDGGAILNESSLSITSSTFRDSAANFGGAIFNDGGLKITNSTFSGNHAVISGGAIYNNGSLTIAVSTFSSNSAASGGGAIISFGGLIVTRSTFTDNAADVDGGAISSDNSLIITNSTFSRNTAASDGGVIINRLAGTTTLTNSTIAANVGGAGAVANRGDSVRLQNVVLDNSASNCGGEITDGGGNIASDASCQFDAPGSRNNIDPLLGPLQNNDGPTETMALQAGSPAIGTGVAPCPVTDQRGALRTAPCDSGAYETDATPAPALTLNSIEPVGGPTAGETRVTITGSGFQDGATVSFGGVGATAVTVESGTEITATTPMHEPGTVAVTVTTPDDQRATLMNGFTYVTAPLANNDMAATEENTAVAINVLANDSGDRIMVTGVGTPAHGTAEITADDSITYTPDAGFTGTDRFPYTITDAFGQTAMATVTVTVEAAPVAAITLGEPAVNGQPAGTAPGPSVTAGSAITIAVPVTNTRNLAVAQLAGTSAIGTLTCQATTLAPSAATTCAVASTAAAGAQQVSITVTAQAATGRPVAASTTAYHTSAQPGPIVTSITPSSGPEAGDTAVTIIGTSFLPGQSSVTFGGAPATSVSCTTTTTCTAVSPPGRGIVSVRVTTPAGTSPDTAAAAFRYLMPPRPMTLSVQVRRQLPPLVSENQIEPTIIPVVDGVVEALIDGVVCGQGVTDRQGRVTVVVAADPPAPGCGQPGRVLSFRVDGAVAASDPLHFQSGGQAAVTLRLPGPMPPPRRF